MRVAKKNKAVQKKTARSGMSENKAAWQNSLSVHHVKKKGRGHLKKSFLHNFCKFHLCYSFENESQKNSRGLQNRKKENTAH